MAKRIDSSKPEDPTGFPMFNSLALSGTNPVELVLRPRPNHEQYREIRVSSAADPAQPVLNLWTPTPAPATLHRLTPMAAYDINTKLPIHVLATDQIRMEPLCVSGWHYKVSVAG